MNTPDKRRSKAKALIFVLLFLCLSSKFAHLVVVVATAIFLYWYQNQTSEASQRGLKTSGSPGVLQLSRTKVGPL